MLKYLYIGLVLGPLQVCAQTVSSLPGQSLADAYIAALNRSETVNIQQELVVQARELTTQAQGSVMPTIAGQGTWMHEQTPGGPSAAYPNNQRLTKITADQPLFRGFRDFAALRQRKLLADAQVFDLKAAARQLFYDLSTAYYNVLAYQSDEANYVSEIAVNNKRLEELKHFIKIGRSRTTELLTFQSNISQLEAALEAVHGQLDIAKDVLAFLTGWSRETPLSDKEPGFTSDNLDENLKRIENRPDVQAALKNSQAFAETIPIARGGHYPSLDLIGDYYYDRPNLPQGGNDWDVQLVLTIPIFSGGIVQSQVHQAQSVAHQYDLVLSETRRLAEREVRNYYASFKSDVRQVTKLEETYNWAKKTYDAELRDYRNGAVTNLDVLQAITVYQNAQRTLDRERFMVQLDSVRLQAAIGVRPELDVSPKKN